ncbi:MAG: glycosyltransferase family 2 protein [Clostridiales bacterium]|nr:glycosyltransferase family 2 protein [Clostridiales bacterium]
MMFSVIIPVYNCQETITHCVESLQKQTFTDFEIILIDDGSKDDSLKLCEKMKEEDQRIKVITQSNQGAGAARNKGLKAAEGEYIIFCDSDDFYVENAFEKFFNVIHVLQPDLIVGSYCEIHCSGNTIKVVREKKNENDHISSVEEVRKHYPTLHHDCMITSPWAKAYKSSVIKSHDIEFPDLRRCQDVVFNVRFYGFVKSMSLINDVVYCYNTSERGVGMRKYPKHMYKIQAEVYNIIKDRMINWGVWNLKVRRYFNTNYVRDTMMLLRLNLSNNWDLDASERKELSKTILNDECLLTVLKEPVNGYLNKIFRLVMKTKNILLINAVNSTIVLYKNVKTSARRICDSKTSENEPER